MTRGPRWPAPRSRSSAQHHPRRGEKKAKTHIGSRPGLACLTLARAQARTSHPPLTGRFLVKRDSPWPAPRSRSFAQHHFFFFWSAPGLQTGGEKKAKTHVGSRPGLVCLTLARAQASIPEVSVAKKKTKEKKKAKKTHVGSQKLKHLKDARWLAFQGMSLLLGDARWLAPRSRSHVGLAPTPPKRNSIKSNAWARGGLTVAMNTCPGPSPYAGKKKKCGHCDKRNAQAPSPIAE